MTRNYLADYNLFAISANLKETALNTEQTLDTLLRISKANIIEADLRSESNADELTGREEPDRLYNLGYLLGKTIEFPKAQPQHFAIGYCFGLGSSTPTPWGTGFKHLATPTSDMLLPGFTAAMKLGMEIEKRRHASIFIDTLTSTWAKDSWAKLSLALKGTGKWTSNIYEETLTEAFNAISLTLAANGVQGATPAARLDNVHHARVLVPNSGEYQDVVVTIVSGATPAVLTINSPATAVPIEGLSKAAACVVTWVGHGLVSTDKVTISGITQAEWSALNAEHIITFIGVDSFSIPVDTSGYALVYDPVTDPGTIIESTDTSHKLLYVPTEPAWCTFPSYVEEPPLRVTDVVMRIGGKWNGTTFLGGHLVESEVNSVEHVLNNQMLIEFRIGGTGDYANFAIRQGRIQTLKLDRQLRDWILNNLMDKNEYIGIYMKATGDEFETGKNYYVETVFPKCGILKADLKVDGKILGQAGDLQVLEDATYGSVRAEIANQVATYAA